METETKKEIERLVKEYATLTNMKILKAELERLVLLGQKEIVLALSDETKNKNV